MVRLGGALNVGSLFSGIGGIDLGLERAGMHVAWQAESDPWCRSILAKHWPGVPCYDDVRSIGSDAPRVDVLAGGFPCQPVSLAGKRLAQADERWLWPEFARLIRVLRPRYVIAENVPGLLARGLHIVLADLAALGFDAEWTVFGAGDVGAPHRRDRVWIVAWDRLEDAYGGAVESRWRGWRAPEAGELADAAHLGHERPGLARSGRDGSPHSGLAGHSWAVEPDVGRVAHGVPQRVDRLRSLGNAVVPACAEHIGRLVMADSTEREQSRVSRSPASESECRTTTPPASSSCSS